MNRFIRFFAAGSCTLCLVLPAAEFRSDFSGGVSGWNVRGEAAALAPAGSLLRYDTAGTDPAKYRWTTLESPEVMDGDFSVSLDFRILRQDHWNSLRLNVSSVRENAWNASLFRMQKRQGEELFNCVVTVGGKKTEHAAATGAKAGTLRIERKGTLLIFSFLPAGTAEAVTLHTVENCPEGAAAASISFDTPKQTGSAVELTGFSQTWTREAVDVFAPVYLPRQRVADEADGSVQLLVLENGSRAGDGTLRIAPGGRALFGVRGPLNLKGHKLEYRSSGPLKITGIQPGNAETIRLGEVLQWDIPSPGLAEFKPRSVSLGELVTRNQNQRGWNHPHLSADNVFFFTVTPAAGEEIRFGSPVLSGSPLRPLKPFIPAARAASQLIPSGGNAMLAWKTPAAGRGWFRSTEAPFRSGERRVFGGVPYTFSPTLLGPELPSLSIPVGEAAGTIRFLHTAGPQEKDSSPLAAAWLIVYEDGTAEPLFAVLRWNCGVWSDGYLPRGSADFTWWGPPGFTHGEAHRMPRPPLGVTWDALYTTAILNPHPEKKIRELIACQMPGDKRNFALLGVTFERPENSRIALVEPDEATFEPGKPLGVTVMEYAALPAAGTEQTVPVTLERKGGNSIRAGKVKLAVRGRFLGGRASVTPAGMPGPVRITAGNAASSLLGLMPEPAAGDKPFHLTMIAGGGEPRGDFERIRRLGYDSVKIHLPWVENEPGKVEWPGWRERIGRIAGEGLKIGFRNHIGRAQPGYVKKQAAYLKKHVPGQPPQPLPEPDPADPLYRGSVTTYYRETAKLANEFPETVFSINANYGIRSGLGLRELSVGDVTMRNFRRALAGEFTPGELGRRLGRPLSGWDAVTPELVMADTSRTLLPRLVRMNMRDLGTLQRDVAAAIRETGCRAHLTFNVPFHPTEHKLLGLNTTEYLKLSREFAPGSIFHETSDRYCLSFVKWLLAKRTMNLPYGDEGNQPPPTYEHNILSYQWMAMMQCYDALYCQWFGGRPAAQNIAWLKPYYKLLYNAEYLPDPVALAFSLDTGYAESPDIFPRGVHQTTLAHYSLANLLRELNINADRYMVDRFPEYDRNVKCRLMIDDITRDVSPEFGDRIEAFIRNGGTFLASLDTDKLNNHAFFRRFGIETAPDGTLSGKGVTLTKGIRTVAEKAVGKGKVMILAGSWRTGNWDPGEPEPYLSFARNLLLRAGAFRPLVKTDAPGVFATPYRTQEGDVIVQLLNITAVPREVRFSVDATLVPHAEFFDHGSGTLLPAAGRDGYLSASTGVGALGSTLIRMRHAKENR